MFLWCQFVNGAVIVSGELPSYPGRMEGLHSFNSSPIFAKGEKYHMSVWKRQCAFGFEGNNLYYAWDETLFLLRGLLLVLGSMAHWCVGFDMPFVFPTSTAISNVTSFSQWWGKTMGTAFKSLHRVQANFNKFLIKTQPNLSLHCQNPSCVFSN